MRRYRTDLHIHTVLSACADLDMSPGAIVRIAKSRNIDLIGITDHNSTLQCKLTEELAVAAGIAVLCGVEVTTREEVHCLAYFGDLLTLDLFQLYLDTHLPKVPYKPEQMGYQVMVDRDEKVVTMVENYLNIALNQTIDEVEQEVHRLGGLFVPAHVERPMYGIFNQLGFMPDDLKCDALGIMSGSSEKEIRDRFHVAERMVLVKASDAHSPGEIGTGATWLEMEDISFEEIKMAFQRMEGRNTVVA